MAKRKGYAKGAPLVPSLDDKDWLMIITALLRDSTRQSEDLARRLLAGSKYGRQIRLLQFLARGQLRSSEMIRSLRVSRRTVFRDLSNLEEYGVELNMVDQVHYVVVHIPKSLETLLRVKQKAPFRLTGSGRRRPLVR